eukprot:TRINITY_DN2936_c0_g1_i2.p1 TRINITY_DN2936_c0_g1~~TRINITY_DN2936_c0_g1_i2.p1  ORF type:complete len:196 (-),score=38.76 TRINITY_DN2936_c0_g1_i2:250-786(-)
MTTTPAPGPVQIHSKVVQALSNPELHENLRLTIEKREKEYAERGLDPALAKPQILSELSELAWRQHLISTRNDELLKKKKKIKSESPLIRVNLGSKYQNLRFVPAIRPRGVEIPFLSFQFVKVAVDETTSEGDPVEQDDDPAHISLSEGEEEEENEVDVENDMILFQMVTTGVLSFCY